MIQDLTCHDPTSSDFGIKLPLWPDLTVWVTYDYVVDG
jgi:hypothetical protein